MFDQKFSRFLGFPTMPNLFQSNKNCRSYDAKCKILPSENEQTLVPHKNFQKKFKCFPADCSTSSTPVFKLKIVEKV